MVEPPPDAKRQRLGEEEPEEAGSAGEDVEGDGMFPLELDADEGTLAEYTEQQGVLDKVGLARAHSRTFLIWSGARSCCSSPAAQEKSRQHGISVQL